MMTREAPESRSPTERAGLHRLIPIAGVTAAVIAVVGHFGVGAAVVHLGLGAGLTYLGVNVANLGGGALLVGLAAIISVKLLLVFGAHRWWRHR